MSNNISIGYSAISTFPNVISIGNVGISNWNYNINNSCIPQPNPQLFRPYNPQPNPQPDPQLIPNRKACLLRKMPENMAKSFSVEERECCICLNEMPEHDVFTTSSCFHMYHKDCLEKIDCVCAICNNR
jgi:hypothetical protein